MSDDSRIQRVGGSFAKLKEENARLKEERASKAKETELWHRYVCAAIQSLDSAREMRDEGAEYEDIAKHCADFADAMLEQAKTRRKV